ncbi:hypothetical protein FOZ62_032295, partial [Perkinsus olseni]
LEYTDLYHTSRSSRFRLDLRQYAVSPVHDDKTWTGARQYRIVLNHLQRGRRSFDSSSSGSSSSMGNRPNSTFSAFGDRRGSDDAASTVDTATSDGVEAKDSWKMKLKDSLEHAGEDVKKLVHHEGSGASVEGQALSVVEFDRIAFKFMRRIEADRWHRAMLKGIELAMNAEDEDGYVQPSTGTDGVLLDEVDDGDGGGSEDDTSGEKKVTMPHLKRLLPSVVVAQLSYFFSRSSYVLLAVPLDGVTDPTSSLLLNGVSFGLAFLKLSLLSTIFGGLVIAMALLLDMAVEGGRG